MTLNIPRSVFELGSLAQAAQEGLPADGSETGSADASEALHALDAFDTGIAVLDLAQQQLGWCSAGFSAACGVQAPLPLAELAERLPGMQDHLAQLLAPGDDASPTEPPARIAWSLQLAPDRWLEAQLAARTPERAVLRLCDVRAQGEAAQRHLADRERLLFTSRALSVGEMASTLAHEINQPIGAVTNVLRGMQGLLQRPGSDPAMLLRGVDLALEQASYAARIVTRIREYTLSRTPRRAEIELAQLVRDSIGLLDWDFSRHQVQVSAELPAQPCTVLGDEVMLQQMLVNLMRNAIDAMAATPLGERRLVLVLALRNGQAQLSLRDTGCGLPQDADDQLFAPFQSTKPNGMGIGLNICRSFAELHQGRLWFSRPDAGPGAIFHVHLPLAPASAPAPATGSAPAA